MYIFDFDSVEGEDGNDRLVLRCAQPVPSPKARIAGFDATPHDFYELVWMRRKGQDWQAVASITADQMSERSAERSWIAGLGAFAPANSSAVVKLAKGNTRGTRTEFEYFWCRVDFRTGGLGIIKRCSSTNPHERYADS